MYRKHSILFFFVLVVMFTTKTFSFINLIKNDSVLKLYNNELKQTKDPAKKADIHFKLGNYYSKINKENLAFSNYTKALTIFEKLNLKEKEMDCNLSIFSLLDSQNNIKIEALPYLDKYYKAALYSQKEEKMFIALLNYGNYNFNKTNYRKAQSYYSEALSLSKKTNDSLGIAKINTNLGLLYSGFIKDQDSAKIFFENALKIYPKNNMYERFITYINYANAFEKEHNFKKSIEYLKKAERITPEKHKLNLQKILFSKFSNAFQNLGDFENAFNYYNKYNTARDSINITNQNIEISKIKEQYDNEKLRADNLEIEAQRKQNRNFLIGALFIIFAGSIFIFQQYKNSKRKQQLIKQEKELETQKLTAALKEQELLSIDAMIEGQEKERQRIANDLHDDLGGLMTTIKWHFNTLEERKSPEILEKTNLLLDEAYQKIRSIAHAKNSGVIAKQGLLKAVQNMADTISINNKLQISVIDHGLENQLENSLELTIFRIIQELITNIIKHAQATEVNIHITNHDDSLNIMVEDNGIGFNPSQITKTKKGMGISSIDKRIEHLLGKMTIESEPNKGATVIIDIPI